MNEFKVDQQIKFTTTGDHTWCSEMWFIASGFDDHAQYMRDDRATFNKMQRSLLDLEGGTYFATKEDAQNVLDNYYKFLMLGREV